MVIPFRSTPKAKKLVGLNYSEKKKGKPKNALASYASLRSQTIDLKRNYLEPIDCGRFQSWRQRCFSKCVKTGRFKIFSFKFIENLFQLICKGSKWVTQKFSCPTCIYHYICILSYVDF